MAGDPKMQCPKVIKCILLPIILVGLADVTVGSWLWFPRYSVLQVTMAMVMPFEHPQFKVAMNMAVQCNYNLPWNVSEFTNPMYWAQRDLHSAVASNDTRFKRDISGGEFYSALQTLMTARGFHSTCVRKTVCEMAQHTFHEDEDNILTTILHFVFTPSLHDSFEDHEHASRDRFAEAETLGHLSQCTEAFPDCPSSLIEAFSYLDAE